MGYRTDQDARERLKAAFIGLAAGLVFLGVVAGISFVWALNAH
jgi:hypothetical protein